jgi:hypothetical protein
MWPKPLPNHWLLGWVTGVTVDARDHVWIVHQANKLSAGEQFGDKNVPGSCCFAAPPVLEFDQAGNLVGHWGGPGPGYDWLDSPHGINLDYKDNVWIAGTGKGASQSLKFTRAGKFLLPIGRPKQKQDSFHAVKFLRNGVFETYHIYHNNALVLAPPPGVKLKRHDAYAIVNLLNKSTDARTWAAKYGDPYE